MKNMQAMQQGSRP